MSGKLNNRQTRQTPQSTSLRLWEILTAIFVSSLVLGINLHLGFLPFDNDALYSDVARTMVQTGDWLNPQIHGVPFLDKPPLHFWITASFIELLGESVLALRLPAALFGVFTCILMLVVARGSGLSRLDTFITCLVMFSIPLFVEYSRRAYMEVPVACCVFGALVSYCHAIWGVDGRCPGNPKWFLVAGTFLGLAFMEKSLVAIFAILPLLVLVVCKSQYRALLKAQFAYGLFIAVALIVPWHIYQLVTNAEVFLQFTYKLHVENQFLDAQPWSTGPIWFYLEKLVFELPVLGVFILVSLICFALNARKSTIEPLDALMGLFVVIALLVFSISETKKTLYLVLIIPPAGLLFGRMMAVFLPRKKISLFLSVCIVIVGLRSIPLYLPNDFFLSGTHDQVKAARAIRDASEPTETVYVLAQYFSIIQFYSRRRTVSYWPDEKLVHTMQRIPYLRYGNNMRLARGQSIVEIVGKERPGIWVIPLFILNRNELERKYNLLYESEKITVWDCRFPWTGLIKQ